jgi:hypothetical protein
MPTIITINLLLALLVVSGSNGACSTTVGEKTVVNTRDAQSTTAPAASTTTTRSIRSIDFANFTYPGQYIFTKGPKSFTLEQGRFAQDETQIRLAYVDFGDVTGDGVEDAFIVLAPVLTGSATPLVIYIYSLKVNRPELLWAFSTGDRADEGLRRVYADNGRLIVERFSPINSNGACCPTQFTRTRYLWDGAKFKQSVTPETLPNPSRNADTAMPEYKTAEEKG